MLSILQNVPALFWPCFVSCLLFFGIGLWADRRKKPMRFYSGVTLDPATISDIPAYNRANGRMWKIYAIAFLLAGIASFWSSLIALIILLLALIPGVPFLFLQYGWIRRKFKA